MRSTTVTLAPMPSAIVAACVPETPPPRTTTSAGRHARHAAEQDAAPALRLFQRMRADLRRQAAGDFRHRRQQRQAAVGRGHRLVGDAGRAAGDEVARLREIGREMQIGEQGSGRGAAACARR